MTRRYGSQQNWHASPCLSCNFRANEDKIKILSLGYLVSLIDVVWDTIHCQEEGYHWFCNAHNFCTFFKNLPFEKLLAWLQWWLVASSKPRSHICDIFYLFCMHSVKFLKGPSLTFLTNKFTIFSAKKPWNYSSKMSEHSCWKFLLNTWAISLRVHKYGFVLLNRLGIATNTVFSNPRTANYWKMSKNGFHSKHLCKYIVTYLYSIDCTQNQIPKSCPTHKRKNLDFIFIGSDVTTQTRLKMSITLWPIALRHLTQRKKCDDFWLPGVKSFQTIYNMDDFAVIIFSRYYTLIKHYICTLVEGRGRFCILCHVWYLQNT